MQNIKHFLLDILDLVESEKFSASMKCMQNHHSRVIA